MDDTKKVKSVIIYAYALYIRPITIFAFQPVFRIQIHADPCWLGIRILIDWSGSRRGKIGARKWTELLDFCLKIFESAVLIVGCMLWIEPESLY